MCQHAVFVPYTRSCSHSNFFFSNFSSLFVEQSNYYSLSKLSCLSIQAECTILLHVMCYTQSFPFGGCFITCTLCTRYMFVFWTSKIYACLKMIPIVMFQFMRVVFMRRAIVTLLGAETLHNRPLPSRHDLKLWCRHHGYTPLDKGNSRSSACTRDSQCLFCGRSE